MKFIKYLLYFVLGLAALIGVFGIFAKNTYHIERSIEIDAPRELVYEQIRFDVLQVIRNLNPRVVKNIEEFLAQK